MSKELEALKIITCYGTEINDITYHEYLKAITIVEEALNELEDAKHNYKAVKEMYDNSVAYATKIQKELNELKKRNEPMKVLVAKHYVGYYVGFGYYICPKCEQTIIEEYYNYCPDCGQRLDWSDDK